MSVKLGDAVVYFKANSSQLDKDTDNAKKKTKSSFAGLAGSLNTLIGGAIVGGVGAAVAGVAAIGAAAIGVANDFQAARNTISTQLGGMGVDTEAYGETAKRIFANNFGGSIDEAAKALAEVRKQLGDLPQEELQNATENAFRLSDAFGEDMSKNVNAAKVLMEQFGLTQGQAFDFITTGFQKGLNSSGDFLDSIGEYGNLFAQGGADAGQFFSFMETGLQGGVLGTDKAADAFKEFQIRLLDGSDSTREALAAIGFDSEKMAAAIESGQMTSLDAFGMVQAKLGELDTVTQNQVGVALIGTQFEDLGMKAVAGIDTAKTALGDMAGATAGLDEQYNSLGQRFEGLKRTAMVALEPLGTQLLTIVETAMPSIQSFVDWIAGTAIPWITTLFTEIQTLFVESGIAEAFAGYQAIATQVFGAINEALGGPAENFSLMETILWAVEKVFGAMAVAGQLAGVQLYYVGNAVAAIITAVQSVVEWFGKMKESLSSLEIPDWLQMHSPPPLAQALDMVKEQVKGLGDMKMPGLIDPAQQGGGAGGGAIAGGGNQTIQLVVDGQVLSEVVNNHLGGMAAAGV